MDAVVTAVEARCPSCGDAVATDDAFCERCGAALAPAARDTDGVDRPCVECGGDVAVDGYCGICGHKQPTLRDHLEIDLGDAGAAVTDRGKRHARNEDAMALVRLGAATLLAVVCDGVSSVARSDEASQGAVDAAVAATSSALDAGSGPGEALLAGAAAAQAATVAIGLPESVPSCTFVAVLATGSEVTAASVGDSRAYLVDAATITRLTLDDSWARAAVEAGSTEAEALRDPRAHQITRWLGADSPDPVPAIRTATTDGPSTLVVCSDGLWNELTGDEQLQTFVNGSPTRTPIELAAMLCDFANECGGHDNISVIVVPMPTHAPSTNLPTHTGAAP